MFESVKFAFSRFMYGYWSGIAPTTPQLANYVKRPFKSSVVWASTRMIDKVEEMFGKYLRVDDGDPTNPHLLPVIIAAMARDYSPTGRDYGRQIADPRFIILKDDPKERLFKIKTVSGDIRVQVAFFAREEPSCKSLAAQFLLYLDETQNRRFWANYRFAGIDTKWPVHIEAPDSPAMNIETGAKNLNILTVDLNLKVTTPMFLCPKDGEPNDGKGSGTIDDPHGFPMVGSVHFDGFIGSDQTIEKDVS